MNTTMIDSPTIHVSEKYVAREIFIENSPSKYGVFSKGWPAPCLAKCDTMRDAQLVASAVNSYFNLK